MPEWFDYAVCDEIHQLAGDTAQGNALGTLASCTDRIVGLTGTLLGGYADDLLNTLFRLKARKGCTPHKDGMSLCKRLKHTDHLSI
jgi:hypothetical protein